MENSNQTPAPQRKNVIVVIGADGVPEVFGNFKKACEAKGLPYHSLKMKEFPIIHSEIQVHRCKFN